MTASKMNPANAKNTKGVAKKAIAKAPVELAAEAKLSVEDSVSTGPLGSAFHAQVVADSDGGQSGGGMGSTALILGGIALAGGIAVAAAGGGKDTDTNTVPIPTPTPPQPLPSYTVAASATSVDEGKSITFTITDANKVAGQKVTWSVNSERAGDIEGPTSGEVTIDQTGKATVTIAVKADATTEGAETLTFTVGSQNASATITDTSTTPAKTMDLTAGVDSGANFVGTALDDTYKADAAAKLGAFDNIDGGAGTDTIQFTDISNSAFTLSTLATIAGVENLTLNHTSDGATDIVAVDTSLYSSLRSVSVANVGTDIGATGGTNDGVVVTAKGNLTSVTINGGSTAQDIVDATVTDAGTAGSATAATGDKLATISLTGITGDVTVQSDALTTLNVNAVGGLITNTDDYVAAADTRSLAVTYAGGTNGGVTDAGATTVTVTASGAVTAMGTNTFAAATTASYTANGAITAGTLAVGAATTVNVAANAAITASTITAGVATALNLSGSAAMTLTQTLAAAAVITSTSTGAVTLNTAIAAGQKYVGGTGVDTVTFAGNGTTASSLGGGDDVATFSAAAGTGGSVDAGTGTDTVVLTAADAVAVTASAAFEDDIANFEQVSIGAYLAVTADNTISLANLDDINYVISAGAAGNIAAQTHTISGFATGGTFKQTALFGANANLALTGAFTGAADSFNLIAAGTDGFADLGSVTLADVETIKITLDDTDTTAATTAFDLNLDATSATSVTVLGDAGVTFANSSLTALRTLDASGVTASGAGGAVTFTANAFDTTIKGGAGNDVFNGNSAIDTISGNDGDDTIDAKAGNDVIDGGAGKDTLTGGTGVDSITGGAGADTFVFSTRGTIDTGATAATADTILDFAVADTLKLDALESVAGLSGTSGTGAGTNVEVSAGGKVTFAAADNTLALKLAAIAADDTDIAATEVVFFEDGGNTYVFGEGASTTVSTDDFLIVLKGVTGLTTLTESTITGGNFTFA